MIRYNSGQGWILLVSQDVNLAQRWYLRNHYQEMSVSPSFLLITLFPLVSVSLVNLLQEALPNPLG